MLNNGRNMNTDHLNQKQKSDWTWWGWIALIMLGLTPKDHKKVFSWASPTWEGLLGHAQQEAGCDRTATEFRNFLGFTALESRCRGKCSAKLLWIQSKWPDKPCWAYITNPYSRYGCPAWARMAESTLCSFWDTSGVSVQHCSVPEAAPLLSRYL